MNIEIRVNEFEKIRKKYLTFREAVYSEREFIQYNDLKEFYKIIYVFNTIRKDIYFNKYRKKFINQVIKFKENENRFFTVKDNRAYFNRNQMAKRNSKYNYFEHNSNTLDTHYRNLQNLCILDSVVDNKPVLLLITASPTDKDYLSNENECYSIALESKKRLTYSVYKRIVILVSGLEEIIEETKPDLIHFTGHGSSEGICVEDNFKRSEIVTADEINDIIDNTIGSYDFGFLNCCNSNDIAVKLLVHSKNTIGTKISIDDEYARIFALRFYSGMFEGYSSQSSYNKAASEMNGDYEEGYWRNYKYN